MATARALRGNGATRGAQGPLAGLTRGAVALLALLALLLLSVALRSGAKSGPVAGEVMMLSDDEEAALRGTRTAFGARGRPLSTRGVLCSVGTAGQLNNYLIQENVLLDLAQRLGRTLVADPAVDKFYDVERLGDLAHPDVPFAPMVPFSEALCGPRELLSKREVSVNRNGVASPERLEDRLDKIEQASREQAGRALVVSGWDAFYMLGRPSSEAYSSFFGSLYLREHIQAKADDFLRRRIEGRAFNAIHLRWLDGNCEQWSESKELCFPTYEMAMARLRKLVSGDLAKAPLFVAHDRQRSVKTYEKAGAIMYDGPCTGVECAAIDFEICTHATVFLGNKASSADLNIDEQRRNRPLLPGAPPLLPANLVLPP